MTLGEIIRARRKALDLTQAELADRSGLSQMSVSLFENDRRNPSLEAWIDGIFNCEEYGGSESKYKGMSRIDVWNQSIAEVGMRTATDADLNLMLARSTQMQKIKRNGVRIKLHGEDLWYMDPTETFKMIGQSVYVRYDPADLRYVRLYDEQDRCLCTWGLADYLYRDYLEENPGAVGDAMRILRSVNGYRRDGAAAHLKKLDPAQRIAALDMTVRRAHRNKLEHYRIMQPSSIIPVRANEEQTELAVGAEDMATVIDIKRMADNAEKERKDTDHFVGASGLGDQIKQTGAVGKIAGFTVYEFNDDTAGLMFIAGHPRFAARVKEFSVPVKLEDLKDGKHIGASWVNGRMVYAHKVLRPKAIQNVYAPGSLTATLAKGSAEGTTIATISAGNTVTTYAYKVNPTARATYNQTSGSYSGTALTSGTTEIAVSVGDVIEIVNLSSSKVVAVTYVTAAADKIK